MYIITEGVAMYQATAPGKAHILGVGDSWGEEEVILTNPAWNRRPTRAITYLRVLVRTHATEVAPV